MNQNANVVRISDASIPDSVVSGEKTLDEFIDEKLAARDMADEHVAERDRLVDALVTGSTEYDEDDRGALKQTPVPILEKLAENAPGVTDAPTANMADDLDDYDLGVEASGTTSTPTVSGDDDPDAYDTGVGREK